MISKLLLGMDIGTSNMKAVLLSVNGERIAFGKCEVEFVYPKEGLVEILPGGYFNKICSLIKEMKLKAPSSSKIIALSMAVASGNIILLNKNGRNLTNIISCFLDNRTKEISKEVLRDFNYKDLYSIVGWPWEDNCAVAHLAWLKKTKSELYKKTAHFCMNNDYLLYRLTGKFGMDYSNAATFYLQDQIKKCWHKPCLEKLGIQESGLSKIFPSGTPFGYLTKGAGKRTGLGEDTLVVLGSYDHPAAARSACVINPGEVLLSCGSSWVIFYPDKDRKATIKKEMEILVDHYLFPGGPWGMMYSLPWIGLNVEWYIDNLIIDRIEEIPKKYDIFNNEALKEKRGKGKLYINPSINIKNSPDLHIILDRIKCSYSKSEISLALMEGVAFEVKKVLKKLSITDSTKSITMVGGPSKSHIWPKIVSEIIGVEVKIIENGEYAGAVGAAILAGIGSGVFSNELEEYKIIKSKILQVEPCKEMIEKYKFLYLEYLSKT